MYFVKKKEVSLVRIGNCIPPRTQGPPMFKAVHSLLKMF